MNGINRKFLTIIIAITYHKKITLEKIPQHKIIFSLTNFSFIKHPVLKVNSP